MIVDKGLVGAMEKRQNLIIIRDIIDGIKIIKEVPSWVRGSPVVSRPARYARNHRFSRLDKGNARKTAKIARIDEEIVNEGKKKRKVFKYFKNKSF